MCYVENLDRNSVIKREWILKKGKESERRNVFKQELLLVIHSLFIRLIRLDTYYL